MRKKISILLFCALAFLTNAQTKTVFVAPTGNNVSRLSNGTGTSWENAYSNLLTALQTNMAGYTELKIYIKEGNYTNHNASNINYGNGDRSTLPDGVNVYVEGGHSAFATGVSTTTYDTENNPTNFISSWALFQMNASDGNLHVKNINVYEPNARNIQVGPFYYTEKPNAVATFENVKVITRRPINDDPGVGIFHHHGNARNSTINLNKVTVSGFDTMETGVVTFWSGADNSTINITNSLFSNNRITVAQGSVVNMNSINNTLNIENSMFYRNSTPATNAGVILLSSGSNATIKNSTFKGNFTTLAGSGGVIYAESNTKLTSENNVYACNTSGVGSNGGGVMLMNSGSTFISNNDIYVENRGQSITPQGGGALHFYSVEATINNAKFVRNYATYEGGAIRAIGNSKLTINNSKFLNNEAVGGTTLSRGGAIFSENSQLTITGDSVADSWFRNNQSTGAGGAVRFASGTQTYVVKNTGFYGNVAGYEQMRNDNGGGALFFADNVSKNISIDGSYFFDNRTWVVGITTSSNGGGAIKLNTGNVVTSFTNNRFKGNAINGSTDTNTSNGGSDVRTYFASFANTALGTGTILQMGQSRYNNDFPTNIGFTYDGQNSITTPTFPTLDITCDSFPETNVGEIIIIANDDIFDGEANNYLLIPPGTKSTVTVLENDQYNYQANNTGGTWEQATLQNVTISIISTQDPRVTLDTTTGLVSVADGTPPGVYYIEYRITSIADTGAHDNAFVVVLVPGPVACFEDATTGTGLTTKHGISSLQRAATAINLSDGWPTVRKSAWTVLESNTKGFVITRMTTAQINAIAHPQDGMMTYDTTEKCLKIYDGTEWACFSTATCP
ncbi:MAG: right-handed parallel beta-helix repeat-containing protein [Cruoricaptor ignavus]|nr:right-handed parallel beta-helix repeat-containing protein [Cruoricaptor ignavus]